VVAELETTDGDVAAVGDTTPAGAVVGPAADADAEFVD
jgi:hypothetical protein